MPTREVVVKETSWKHVRMRRVGGVALISPKHNLIGGDETDELRQVIKELVEAGNRCLVVNFREVEFITSMGLGVFAEANATYRNRNGEVRLCQLGTRVNSIFVITKLIMLFDHHANEEEAIAAFAGKQGGCPDW